MGAFEPKPTQIDKEPKIFSDFLKHPPKSRDGKGGEEFP
jgi:hypothetical protein